MYYFTKGPKQQGQLTMDGKHYKIRGPNNLSLFISGFSQAFSNSNRKLNNTRSLCRCSFQKEEEEEEETVSTGL